MVLEFSMQNVIYGTTIKAATTTCSNAQEKKILRKFLVKSLSKELYPKIFSESAGLSDVELFASN